MAAADAKIELQRTPSIGLNFELRGGLAYGRTHMFWGNKSAGKSTFLTEMIGIAQKEGRTAAWIDAEGTFDSRWATQLGVDTSNLIVSPTKSVERAAHDGVQLIQAGVDILVIDSISQLLPAIYFEKEDKKKKSDAGGELKDLSDTKQIGALSRDLGIMVNMLNYANKNTMICLISQVRNQITTYGAMHSYQGGFAVAHASSTVVKFWASPKDDEQLKGEVQVGDLLLSRNIGRKVTWTIQNSKTSAPSAGGEYDFYYAGGHIGVDKVGEVLDFAVRLGVLEKSGNWYILDGQSYNGRNNAVGALREQPDLFNEIEDKVYAKIQ